MDIPKNKDYPKDSVQCGECGGLGCALCMDKGWLTPKDHRLGRLCRKPDCNTPLAPNQFVYCSDKCMHDDIKPTS